MAAPVDRRRIDPRATAGEAQRAESCHFQRESELNVSGRRRTNPSTEIAASSGYVDPAAAQQPVLRSPSDAAGVGVAALGLRHRHCTYSSPGPSTSHVAKQRRAAPTADGAVASAAAAPSFAAADEAASDFVASYMFGLRGWRPSVTATSMSGGDHRHLSRRRTTSHSSSSDEQPLLEHDRFFGRNGNDGGSPQPPADVLLDDGQVAEWPPPTATSPAPHELQSAAAAAGTRTLANMGNMAEFSSEEAVMQSNRRGGSGVFVSTRCGFGLVLLAVLIAVVVGLIVNFAVTKEISVVCGKDDATPPVAGVTSGLVQQCVKDCERGIYCPASSPAPTTLPTSSSSSSPHLTVVATTDNPATTAVPPAPSKPNMRLPLTLRPYYYDVELKPDIYRPNPADFIFEGTVKISFTCLQATSVVTLHKNKLNVTSYELAPADDNAGSPSVVRESFDEATQFLQYNTSQPLTVQRNYTLTLKFISRLLDDLSGLYYSSYLLQNGTRRYIATTQMEPTDARKTFPCFDEPAMKAVFKVAIWRKSHMTALSNMPLEAGSVTKDDGWIVDRFEPTKPMSTYLLAFIVCDFKYVEGVAKGNVKIRVWAREESINQTAYALNAGIAITDHFADFFGQPYPLPKQDMIAIPDFSAGAMENWGLITYRETALLYDPEYASASNKQRVAVVVSHELAHQWFGNLVSPAWWDDLWLNEGFATYVEYLGVQAIEPEWQMMTQILWEDVFSVKLDDSLATSHPIYVPVNDPDEINEIFDSISYAKGGSIIRQIRFVMGDTVFQNGLKAYLLEKSYDNANKGDLWNAWKKAAQDSNLNIDVPAIMDTWTNQMGYPLITVSYKDSRSSTLTQEHFLLDNSKAPDPRYPSPFNYRWEVPLTITTDKNPSFNQDYRNITWMHKDESQKVMNIDYDKWFIVNVGSYGFYRVDYDNAVWDGLVNQLVTNHKVIHENNRGQLLDDAFNLVKAGSLEIDKALDVTRYLCKEQDFVPLQTGLGALSEIDGLLEKSSVYGQFEAYMKNLLEAPYVSIGGFNDDGSSHIDQLKRVSIVSRACSYNVADCRTKAQQAFNDWMKYDKPISTNLRTIAYCYGVRLGGTAEWEFVYQKFKTQTKVATESIKLLNALSCTQELWLLNRMLNYSLNGSEIRRQDGVSAIVYVSNNPLGKYLAWNFVRANWDNMFKNFGGGSFSFSNLILGVLKSFNTPYELSEVIDFGTKNAGKLGSASRAFEQAKERIVNNIKYLAENEQKIANWLSSHTGKVCDTSVVPAKPNMRLPGSLSPYHYALELTPDIYKSDPKDFVFDGHVSISFTCQAATSVITLHKNKLEVLSQSVVLVHADGSPGAPSIVRQTFDDVTQFLRFETNGSLVPLHNYTVTMTFNSTLRNDLTGLYYSSYKLPDGTQRYIATTQMEPTDARKAFPCFDEPAMKAEFSVSILRKSNMVALSNMPILQSTSLNNGWFKDTFHQTPRMSTYLLAFIVCDFTRISANTSRNTEVSVWARRESIGQAEYALNAGKVITEYFETYFGQEFPLPKQDMIAIPDFAAGAMENWGLITYRETALLYDKNFASASNKQRVAVVVSHELAHQWFGNLVSPEWWDDLWLNEGFASYVEYLGVNRIEPTWEMMTQILLEDVFSVKLDDSLATSHPIYVPVNDPYEINEIFDSISYAKGASIIRQIQFVLGDDVFVGGLRTYLTERRLQNANRRHLWDAWSRAAQNRQVNINVSAIMDTWTDQMGYPLIRVSCNPTTCTMQQEHFLLDKTKPTDPRYPSRYGFKWAVPLTFTTNDAPNFQQNGSDVLWMKETEASKNVPITFSKWIIVNIGSYGFYRVLYEDNVWNELEQQLVANHTVIHENNRGQLLDDAFNLVKAGLLNISVAMGLTKYLRNERSYVPLAAGFSGLGEIDGLLEQSSVYGRFEKYMRGIIESQYAAVGGNFSFDQDSTPHVEQVKKVSIVSRACAYDVGDCRSNAKEAFRQWMENNVEISTNLRSTAYCYGVKLGGAPEWEFVYQKFKNQTNVATESIKLLNALSCTTETWLLNRMLNYALDSSEIRRQDAVSAIVYVSNNPLGKYMGWNFVRENWDFMYTQFGSGSFSFSNLISGVLRSFSTQYQLSEVEDFGAKNANKLGSASRAFQQAKERIQTNIKFLATNEKKIGDWLDAQAAVTL